MTHSTNIDYSNSDAVCCVLVDDRSVEMTFLVLDTFLKEKEELSTDYCENPKDPTKPFQTEKEMISFYSKAISEVQTLFWNEKNERKDMVGASYTNDAKVVYSVTTSANGVNELGILKRLMNLTRSKKGFVSYNQYPEFEDSADFEENSKIANQTSLTTPAAARPTS